MASLRFRCRHLLGELTSSDIARCKPLYRRQTYEKEPSDLVRQSESGELPCPREILITIYKRGIGLLRALLSVVFLACQHEYPASLRSRARLTLARVLACISCSPCLHANCHAYPTNKTDIKLYSDDKNALHIGSTQTNIVNVQQ